MYLLFNFIYCIFLNFILLGTAAQLENSDIQNAWENFAKLLYKIPPEFPHLTCVNLNKNFCRMWKTSSGRVWCCDFWGVWGLLTENFSTFGASLLPIPCWKKKTREGKQLKSLLLLQVIKSEGLRERTL